MASRRRENVTESELMDRILNTIWDRGEVIESDLYGLVGAPSRIRPVLEELTVCGILDSRIREHGQRVPVYFYTRKGRLFCLVNRFGNELRSSDGEMNLDSDEVEGIYGNLQRHFRLETEE